MMKFFRPSSPAFLSENYRAWGREHKVKRDADAAAPFQWKSYSGQRVNTLILQAFGIQADHCAFCDGYPLGPLHDKRLSIFDLFHGTRD
jgi:hypothetical protein